MKVHFVGAGPGDPELLTVKAQRLLRQARCCVYAGSLVNPAILELLPADAARHDSAGDDARADRRRLSQGRGTRASTWSACTRASRRSTGPSASRWTRLDGLGIEYEITPGISSFQAAAAALRVELTAPEIAQTVILTRLPGRTPMPPDEDLARLARSRATLCIFLSAEKIAEAAATLVESYGEDCPAALVYHAAWPDEKIIRSRLGDISSRIAAAGIAKTAIFLVGWALLRPLPHASRLYDKTFGHGHRREAGR